MTGTVVDSLNDATAALNAATLAVNALEADIATKATAAQTAATTVINNFVNAPPSTAFFVDPVNGNDSNAGPDLNNPMRTLDAVLLKLPRDGFTTIYLLGDVVVSNYSNLYAPITIYGIQKGNSATGGTFSAYTRKLTFLSEAANSPVPGLGRTVAGFTVAAAYIRYQYVSIVMGDPVSAIGQKAHNILQGATAQLSSCSLDAPDDTSLASFCAGVDGARSSLWFSGSLGPNASGRIVSGVPAGQNPNAYGYTFQSNLLSA